MCGICGFLLRESSSSDHDGIQLRKMTDAMLLRGPDSSGYWNHAAHGIALGHRRLAIVDLTEAGHQPMHSHCGRYTIVYNGEIYNAAELSKDLSDIGLTQRGHSDTEVLLECCAAFGLEKTISKCIGMFAFALWDHDEQVLTLVRDRLGIKPLYYAFQASGFYFGSELKALTAHQDIQPQLDPDAVHAYIQFSHVPGAQCIYQNCHKLEPGKILRIKQGQQPQISEYWNTAQVAYQKLQQSLALSPGEVTQTLDQLLTNAVEQRMISDVPLGAFLSGGIDSSTVVALMQKISPTPVRTFSIGFHEDAYNEADHARKVAEHLKTDHTQLYVSPEEAQAVIPQMASIYDEPFADSSQIPTFLVSQLARQHVTTALSGDGGDELFCGYTRYFQDHDKLAMLKKVPPSMRPLMSWAMSRLSPRNWDRMARLLFLGKAPDRFGARLHSFASMLRKTRGQLYLQFLTHWQEPDQLVPSGRSVQSDFFNTDLDQKFTDHRHLMQILDAMNYLPNDILTKVDRASMAVSLEARVPLLDHRVFELAWQLTPYHLHDGKGKWPLRSVLYQYVPQSLIDRPKMGFGVPIDQWLRGPLRDWAESLLDPRRLNDEGLFDVKMVRSYWERHLEGENWHYWIWDILMFQAWRTEYLK